ncbi:hypothetical protein MMC20_000309 [Loxospora ochrophaea]|nr:hypothetical protein [Loxospora ochrophaea]
MSELWPRSNSLSSLDDAIPPSPLDEEDLLLVPPEDFFQPPELMSHLESPRPSGQASSASIRRRLPSTSQASNSGEIDLRDLDYVAPVDHNLLCPICQCPFVDPVTLGCEHLFCKECVDTAMRNQVRDMRCCPTCRTKRERDYAIPVPKVITRILDELMVKCPLQAKGCDQTLQRCLVQKHVERYCDYYEVSCPSLVCNLKIFRKDAARNVCLHRLDLCNYCQKWVPKRDIDIHCRDRCLRRFTSCPDCKIEIHRSDLEVHSANCSKVLVPCSAATYGCDYVARQAELDQHQIRCPIRKLGPFLEKQSAQLQTQKAAICHLSHKNDILQNSIVKMQETLGSSADLGSFSPAHVGPQAGAPPRISSESTARHLLSLQESLRDEVDRVSTAISELDARTSMTLMNESLRTKEDMAHTNAAIGSMRVQLHYLMSTRWQNQQRPAMARTQGSSGNGSTTQRTGAGPSMGGLGTNELPLQPIRRLSDSTRQETKL